VTSRVNSRSFPLQRKRYSLFFSVLSILIFGSAD
jgi:hypothetical protein